MSDPFQAALEAMFEAPGSSRVLVETVSGQFFDTRTIRQQPDQRVGFGSTDIVMASNQFMLMRSAVFAPTEGDRLQLLTDDGGIRAGMMFEVTSEPMLDSEGLTWTADAEPVPV